MSLTTIEKDSVVFFSRTRNVSGAPYLAARMARYLLENSSFPVLLIDDKRGFIRRKLDGLDYQFIEFEEGCKINIDVPATLFLFPSHINYVDTIFTLSETTRLFFWDVHPYNFVEFTAFSGLYKKTSATNAQRLLSRLEPNRYNKLRRLLDVTADTNSMVFMAEKNKTYNNELLRAGENTPILPLPIETNILSEYEKNQRKTDVDGVIHICWLGRLDSWKSRVLFRIINDVRDFENNNSLNMIHLHIIGDGPLKSRVEEYCADISASIVGPLEAEALTEYLLAHVHIGFAMGTSALEFAVRYLPSILTSSNLTQDKPELKRVYRWLFDSEGYNVSAEETTRSPHLYTFTEVIEKLRKAGIINLGNKCAHYTDNVHSINKVGSLFVEQLLQCSMTYGALRQLELLQLTPYEAMLFRLKNTYKTLRKK